MVSIEISIADGKCFAVVPFNRDFNAGVKRFGGRWRPPVWVVDMRDEERLRALCREVWGTDGTDKPRLLTLRVDVFAALDGGDASALWVAGRCVASRARRDYEVKLAEGVVILEGGFPNSGGSPKRPLLAAKPGTILEVRDVPEPAALRERNTYKGISIVEPGYEEDLERTTERPGEPDDTDVIDGADLEPLEHARSIACALNLSEEQRSILISELRNALVPAAMLAEDERTSCARGIRDGLKRALALCTALAEARS